MTIQAQAPASTDSEAVDVEQTPQGVTVQGGETASDMKAKFDALGSAIRAGVSPESAAEALALTGLVFTGATPVSLRLPESQADQLEEK